MFIHVKLWTQDKAQKVIDMLHYYSVPNSNLEDWVSRRVVPGSISGPQKYLSEEKEELARLSDISHRYSSIGYVKSCKELIALVERMTLMGLLDHFQWGWWESFC